MEFTFELIYQLDEAAEDTEMLLERLGEVHCRDALLGVAAPDRIGLLFRREAGTLEQALDNSIQEVKRALPTAQLISSFHFL